MSDKYMTNFDDEIQQKIVLGLIPHVHLCPICFYDVPCEMDCYFEADSVENGVGNAHPIACDKCSGRLLMEVDPIFMGM